MKKIAIFIADSNGNFPVPATKGGAVQTLVDHLIKDNSNEKVADIDLYTYYEKTAYEKSKEYKNTRFRWIKIPHIITSLDKIIHLCIKTLFKKKKSISYQTVCSLIYYIRYCSKKLKKERYDYVILENNIMISWIIKLSKYKGKIIYHFHNVPRTDGKCRKVFEKCDKYLCVSEFVSEKLQEDKCAIGKIDNNKIEVLYNCIDTSIFHQEKKQGEEIRNRLKISQDEKMILFVGRMSKEKGIDKLIEAVKKIENIDYKLVIAGSLMHGKNEKDEYKKYINKISKPIENKIIFTGYVDQNEIYKYYNAADVTVLPSVWEEPAGLTMIESIACGSTLITTNSGGIKEYVQGCAYIEENNKQLVENLKRDILNVIQEDKKNNLNNQKVIAEKYNMNGYFKRLMKSIEK